MRFLIFLTLLFLTFQVYSHTLQLTGEIEGIPAGTIIHLKPKADTTIFSTEVLEDGKFYFDVPLLEPIRAYLEVTSPKKKFFSLYLHPGKIKYKNSLHKPEPDFIELHNFETPAEEILYEQEAQKEYHRLIIYFEELSSFWIKHKNLGLKAKKQAILEQEFVANIQAKLLSSPSSFSSAMILEDMVSFNPLNSQKIVLQQIFDQLAPNIQNSIYGKRAKQKLEKLLSVYAGEKAEEFSFTTPKGEKKTLNDYKGKTVLIEFWASWCGPCIGKMPSLVELQKKYEGKDFLVIAISIDDRKKDWLSILEKKGYPFVHGMDTTKEIAKAYNVSGVPDNFLIDPNGYIVGQMMTAKEVKSYLKKR